MEVLQGPQPSPENVLKDAAPIRIKDLDAKIAALMDEFKQLQLSLEIARSPFLWRSVDQSTLDDQQDKVASLRPQLKAILTKLHGDQGIDKDFERIKKPADIPVRLDALVSFEFDCLEMEICITRLERLVEKKYLKGYLKIAELIENLKTITGSQRTIEGKFDHLTVELTTLFEYIKQNDLYDQASEMLRLVQAAADHIQPENQDDPSPKNTFISRFLELSAEFDEAKQQYAECGFPKVLWDSNSMDEEVVATSLTRYQSSNYDFTFWKNGAYIPWLGSFVGLYKEGQSKGKMMESGIAFQINGLKKPLKNILAFLALSKISTKEHKERILTKLLHCLAKLQTELNNHRTQIYAQSLDKLTPTLLSYANGLDLALDELRSLHGMIGNLIGPLATSLFKAQWALKQFLILIPSSPFSPEKALQDAYSLFLAGGFANATVVKLVNNLADSEINPFLVRMIKVVVSIYKKHSPERLALVEKERDVWKCVMGRKPLDALCYEAKKAEVGLPLALQTFITKRVSAAIFFPPQPGKWDVELELLLHVIRSDNVAGKQFIGLVETDKKFRQVILKYEKIFGDNRDERLLVIAADLTHLIIQALAEDTLDVLIYAKAWQLFFEFKNKQVDPEHQRQHQLLVEFLLSQLNQVAASFIPMSIKIREEHLRDWVTELDNDVEVRGFTLLSYLESYKYAEDQKGLFSEQIAANQKKALEGFLFKALSACLFATNMGEREIAQSHVANLLELEEYAPYREGISENTRCLIGENTMEKIFQNVSIGKNEAAIFFDGPVKDLLESNVLNPLVKTALFMLMKTEQLLPENKRPFSDYYDRFKEKYVLQDFFKDCDLFLASF